MSGQAGSLGIWEASQRKWVFTYSDEGFCVEALIRIPSTEHFAGWASYHYPCVGRHGDFLFLCGTDGCYSDKGFDEVDACHTDLATSWMESDMHWDSPVTLSFAPEQQILRLQERDRTRLYSLPRSVPRRDS
ncbi:MAG: hypothetical protein K2X49_19670 [Acetobacteraceae bacterium]|nr:hypothetical protein [Acetobacteraceae bacterium]